MSTSESGSRSALVMELAEEFLDRYRAGQRPPLREYTRRHPELADEIREVFPAVTMMEHIAIADDSLDAGEPHEAGAAPAFEQLGDYRVLREVGRGGMGVVYEAEQVSLGRHVALKVLPPQMIREPKHRRRFEREARAAAKLHHTNIIPVFGVGPGGEADPERGDRDLGRTPVSGGSEPPLVGGARSLQGQHVGVSDAGHLLGQRVIVRRQEAAIQDVFGSLRSRRGGNRGRFQRPLDSSHARAWPVPWVDYSSGPS